MGRSMHAYMSVSCAGGRAGTHYGQPERDVVAGQDCSSSPTILCSNMMNQEAARCQHEYAAKGFVRCHVWKALSEDN